MSWEERSPEDYEGKATRLALRSDESDLIQFDWNRGGSPLGSSSDGGKIAKRVYTEALGWISGVAVTCALAFGVVALAIWGPTDDNYAGLTKKDAGDVSAKLLNKTSHADWTFLASTHSHLFGRTAWRFQYKRPAGGTRCVFVWEDGRSKHRMSRLTNC